MRCHSGRQFRRLNKGRQMREPYTDWVIPTLAQHLGVPAREIAPAHDLFRDWGLTPLSLVVILLDLERIVALEDSRHTSFPT